MHTVWTVRASDLQPGAPDAAKCGWVPLSHEPRAQTACAHSSARDMAAASAHTALVVGEHERGLDLVPEGRGLLVADEYLEQREDALAGSRVGREREDDARRARPLGELGAV